MAIVKYNNNCSNCTRKRNKEILKPVGNIKPTTVEIALLEEYLMIEPV